MESFFKKNWIDITILIFLFLCAGGLFALEINVQGPITDREKGIFSAVEFILAIGIGWQSQRIASREEFQKSLKQFAFSAYRRINDIYKSVIRLNNEIGKMRLTYPKEKMHELDLLRSIIDVMNYTIQSSISDWYDIIGEEVRKKERIEELQKERVSLEAQLSPSASPSASPSPSPSANEPEVNQRLKELEREIEQLRSEIPYPFQDDIKKNRELLPREGRLSQLVVLYFEKQILSDNQIFLTISPFKNFGNEEIKLHGPFKVSQDVNMGQLYAVVSKEDNLSIGFIENPFPEVGNDYIYTVYSIIAAIAGVSSYVGEDLLLPSEFILENATIESYSYGSNFIIPANLDIFPKG
jgi:hypothetical protein